MMKNDEVAIEAMTLGPDGEDYMMARQTLAALRDAGFELYRPEDRTNLADRVAFEVGDTFICYDNMSPVEQWARVLRVLSESSWSLVQVSADSPKEGE